MYFHPSLFQAVERGTPGAALASQTESLPVLSPAPSQPVRDLPDMRSVMLPNYRPPTPRATPPSNGVSQLRLPSTAPAVAQYYRSVTSQLAATFSDLQPTSFLKGPSHSKKVVPVPSSRSRRPPPSANPHGWLMLTNSGTDCFLNAAIQLLRRIMPIRAILNGWLGAIRQLSQDELTPAEKTLRILASLLSKTDVHSVCRLRESLPQAVPLLEQQGFSNRQQDASEVIQGLLNLLPDEAKNALVITKLQQHRCSHRTEAECPWVSKLESTLNIANIIPENSNQ